MTRQQTEATQSTGSGGSLLARRKKRARGSPTKRSRNSESRKRQLATGAAATGVVRVTGAAPLAGTRRKWAERAGTAGDVSMMGAAAGQTALSGVISLETANGWKSNEKKR